MRRLQAHRGSVRFQLVAFLVVGGVQVVVDTAVFILLGLAGVPVFAANLVSRTAGACLGFWINGRVTFAARDGHGVDRAALARFVLSWALLTLLGGVLLVAVDRALGLGWTWLAKPLVEAGLAVLGFLALKFFVFAARFR